MGKSKLAGKAMRLAGLYGEENRLRKEMRSGRMAFAVTPITKDDAFAGWEYPSGNKFWINEVKMWKYNGRDIDITPYIVNTLYLLFNVFKTMEAGFGDYTSKGFFGKVCGCTDLNDSETLNAQYMAVLRRVLNEENSIEKLSKLARTMPLSSATTSSFNNHKEALVALELASIEPTRAFWIVFDFFVMLVSGMVSDDKRLTCAELLNQLEEQLNVFYRGNGGEEDIVFEKLPCDLINMLSIVITIEWFRQLNEERVYVEGVRASKLPVKREAFNKCFEGFDFQYYLKRYCKRNSIFKKYLNGDIGEIEFICFRSKKYKTRPTDNEWESAFYNCKPNATRDFAGMWNTRYESAQAGIDALATFEYKALQKLVDDSEKLEKLEADMVNKEKEVKSFEQQTRSLSRGIEKRGARIKQLEAENREMKVKLKEYERAEKSVADNNKLIEELQRKLKEANVREDAAKANNNKLKKKMASMHDEIERLKSESLWEEEELDAAEEIAVTSEISFEEKVEQLKGLRVALVGGVGTLDKELNNIGLETTRVSLEAKNTFDKMYDVMVIMSDRVSHKNVWRAKKAANTTGAVVLYYKGSNKEMLINLLYNQLNK